MSPIAQCCVILACKNAILHKKFAILSSVRRRKPDLCVLGWIAKNVVHAWRHECVGVCVYLCMCKIEPIMKVEKIKTIFVFPTNLCSLHFISERRRRVSTDYAFPSILHSVRWVNRPSTLDIYEVFWKDLVCSLKYQRDNHWLVL